MTGENKKIRPNVSNRYSSIKQRNTRKNFATIKTVSDQTEEANEGYFHQIRSVSLLSHNQEMEIAKRHFHAKRDLYVLVLGCSAGRTMVKDWVIRRAYSKNTEHTSVIMKARQDLKLLEWVFMQAKFLERNNQLLKSPEERTKAKRNRLRSRIEIRREKMVTAFEEIGFLDRAIEETLPKLHEIIQQLGRIEFDLKKIRRRTRMPLEELRHTAQAIGNKTPRIDQKLRKTKIKADSILDLASAAKNSSSMYRKIEKATGMSGKELLKAYGKIIKAHQVVLHSKNQLVEANLRLVIYFAKPYAGKGLALDDLIQEGNIGLMQAVDKFDYRLGYRLTTYASWWIRQRISRAVADFSKTIRLPVHIFEKVGKILSVSQLLRQKLGRRPKPEEIAEACDFTAEQVRSVLGKTRKVISLYKPLNNEGDLRLMDIIEDQNASSPSEIAIEKDCSRQVQHVLKTLRPREEKIIRMRFGLGKYQEHTLDEIGQDFDLTRERIRQIESKALEKLRCIAQRKNFESFIEP